MRNVKAVLVGLAVFWFVSCSSQEQQLLNTFFTAVREGDEVGLSRVSLATFTGSVDSWEILETGPESVTQFGLSALQEKLSKARSELRVHNDKAAYFLDDNRKLYDEYNKKHSAAPDQVFTGQLGSFQEEWEERVAEQEALEEEVEKLSSEITELKRAAALSVNTTVNENFDGSVKGKDLRLRIDDGSGAKDYKFSLIRYDLENKANKLTPRAHWIITDIKEQA
jgi:hypothetical protein